MFMSASPNSLYKRCKDLKKKDDAESKEDMDNIEKELSDNLVANIEEIKNMAVKADTQKIGILRSRIPFF